ncbi:hypothetical protein PENSPDRAFT_627455 [Peniophora sp. CONT]|nr:hypothetical protein PENSPDRAFT_627455 [Peniophora sp. CONT]
MNYSAVSDVSESIFGPPSELIDIGALPDASAELDGAWAQLDALIAGTEPEKPEKMKAECSVDGFRSDMEEALHDPRRYILAWAPHERTLRALEDTKMRARSRKRGRELKEDADLTPETRAFKDKLDAVALKCWPMPDGAALFIRGGMNKDRNALHKIKATRNGAIPKAGDVVLTASVYARGRYTWHTVSRLSQHALLGHQTLGDLYDIIPCATNELPAETGTPDGYDAGARAESLGAVMVIEGVAYGDGLSENDYSDKLIEKLSDPPQKGDAMHQIRLDSLAIRLNEPYWLLHEGSCEHFIVFDQIRFWQPQTTDVPDTVGYPLTTHMAPVGLSLCISCGKVPALYAVLGDLRLGQSPAHMCGPCWRMIGPENAASDVRIVPLPKHEHGWVLDAADEEDDDE